jgi:hypothetical protein
VHLLILHVICSKSGVDQVVRVNWNYIEV